MRLALLLASLGAVAATSGAHAAPTSAAPQIVLTLKDHRFSPDAFSAPVGQVVEITLVNRDQTIEEFDSDDLGVEEVAHPGETIHFKIGPLKPGTYDFMGEFHSLTAHGRVTATAAD